MNKTELQNIKKLLENYKRESKGNGYGGGTIHPNTLKKLERIQLAINWIHNELIMMDEFVNCE